MCLFRRGLCKIADKDIIVYKVVNSNLKSQYYDFQYKIGETYSKKWDKDFINHCEQSDTIGGNAFHSSIDKNEAIWFYGEDSIIKTINDKEIKCPKLHESQILLKCIVPKGSYFFKGNIKDIASDKIVIKEICH